MRKSSVDLAEINIRGRVYKNVRYIMRDPDNGLDKVYYTPTDGIIRIYSKGKDWNVFR